MPKSLDANTKKQLAARIEYYREMGIYDFYRREVEQEEPTEAPTPGVALAADAMTVAKAGGGRSLFESPLPAIQDKPAALKVIREDIGDCTRCRLHKGRTKLVFGVGNVNADLMFVGEGPGADEDAQGEPFVGRAGQLL